ncbi:DUF1801 domain-containing protein [Nonlabens sp. SY33080]|uniref:DUF1801 domain-containing protein n=1 Tax=Nonlabens sp. SY33080 TaxID=2719911 RepID=UPI001428901E|nr:DUF1801 domain-containing protein [Nonlabens sp. SY33080]
MNPAEDYIYKAPEPFNHIMMDLHVLISSNFPDAVLKYKWSLPFYYLKGNIMFCYINFRKKYVDLGLAYGSELSNKHNKLVAGEGRKRMRSLRYFSMDDMDNKVLLETLIELQNLRLNR